MSPSIFKLALAAVGMAALLWSAPRIAAGGDRKGYSQVHDSLHVPVGGLSTRRNTR